MTGRDPQTGIVSLPEVFFERERERKNQKGGTGYRLKAVPGTGQI